MNVTFHTLTSLAVAAALSARPTKSVSNEMFAFSDVPLFVVGFVVNLLLHGLLDYLPHSYPIKSTVDVVLSLGFFVAGMILVRKPHRLLVAVCFLGGIVPDLMDLGPAIFNKQLGWHLPVVKIFPWHWRQYSGSIYDGSRKVGSFVAHVVVIGASLILLYVYRRGFFGRLPKAVTIIEASGVQ